MSGKPDDLEAVRKVVEALKDFDPAEQERIIRWGREKLGLPGTPMSAQPPAAPPTEMLGGPAGQVEPERPRDIKSFIDSKNPVSDRQFAAAVAYYYKFVAPSGQRKETITADDLQNACRMVNRDRLAKPSQTLVNAHHAGLLDKAERGSYAINTVGENLVAMALPERAQNQSATPRRNRKKKKAGKR
jgi:hypothetical protein